MRTRALVLSAACALAVEEVVLPDAHDGDVVVAVEYSGISQGTEVDAWSGHRRELAFPTVTGYQAVGLVEKIGSRVTTCALGDRVLFNSSRLPDDFPESWMGTHLATAVVPATATTPVPDDVDPRTAALTAMLSVALNGSAMVDVGLGSTVLVLGQGLIGQCAARIANARGATVVASEPSTLRAGLSRADVVIDPMAEGAAEHLRQLLGDGADVVVESTGRADLLDSCLTAVRPGGQILLQGYYKDPLVLDFHPWHVRQPTVAFACGFGDMASALALLATGRVEMLSLITHVVTPQEAPDVFASLATDAGAHLGVVIDWRSA